MTRSPEKIAELQARGAEPVLCDVCDADALPAAVVRFSPDAPPFTSATQPARFSRRSPCRAASTTSAAAANACPTDALRALRTGSQSISDQKPPLDSAFKLRSPLEVG